MLLLIILTIKENLDALNIALFLRVNTYTLSFYFEAEN